MESFPWDYENYLTGLTFPILCIRIKLMRVWIGIVVLGIFIVCKNPEKVWQPTPADSAEVIDSLKTWEEVFKASSMIEREPIPFSFPYERIPFTDTLSQKFFPVSLYRIIEDTVEKDSLVFNEDTTCTVVLFERFKGRVEIRCESLTPLLDSEPVPIYDSCFIYRDTTLKKPYHSESWYKLLFRYNHSEDAWILEKVLGVREILSPDVSYSPEIDSLTLSYNSFERSISMDDAESFIPMDSIISLKPGSEIKILKASIDTPGVLFIGRDSLHYDYSYTKGVSFSPKGFHNLLFEVVADSSLIYPDVEYKSILWAIPILIK